MIVDFNRAFFIVSTLILQCKSAGIKIGVIVKNRFFTKIV
jgi:hypothetical protein